MKVLLTIILFQLLLGNCMAQEIGDTDPERAWEQRIFSIENFMNKFNGKLDMANNTPHNITANDPKGRIKNILYLIHHEKQHLNQDSIKKFVLASLDQHGRPLNFKDQDWYAELIIAIDYLGKEDKLKAILNFKTADHDTQYWTLSGISHGSSSLIFTEENQINFPPNSHGNDFSSAASKLTYNLKTHQKEHELLNLIKSGKIKLKHVQKITYHFFQVKDWYFTVNEFERKDQLSGWLISQILFLPEDEKPSQKKKIFKSS